MQKIFLLLLLISVSRVRMRERRAFVVRFFLVKMLRSFIIDQFIFIITSFSPNDDHHRVSLDSFLYYVCAAFRLLIALTVKEHTAYEKRKNT